MTQINLFILTYNSEPNLTNMTFPYLPILNAYPQFMFWAEIRKLPEFFFWKFSFFDGKILSIFE